LLPATSPPHNNGYKNQVFNEVSTKEEGYPPKATSPFPARTLQTIKDNKNKNKNKNIRFAVKYGPDDKTCSTQNTVHITPNYNVPNPEFLFMTSLIHYDQSRYLHIE